MKLRRLGDSDLEVSEISFGTWLTTGVGVDRDTALACVDKAFDLGINFFDTANVYGRGAAETVLGEALKGRARDSFREVRSWLGRSNGFLQEAIAGIRVLRPPKSMPRKQTSSLIGAAITISSTWIGTAPKPSAMSSCSGEPKIAT